MPDLASIQIAPAASDRKLTPEQKRFNTLIKQIAHARQTLADWQDNVALYARSHAELQVPLMDELRSARRRWALALDAASHKRNWTRAERETLRELLCDIAAQLLQDADSDAELRALFARHADVDFDTERREGLRAMKDLTEMITGLDLGEDDDIASEDDLLQRMHQGMAQAQAQAQEDEQEQVAKAPPRRQTAAQKRRETEAQQATQSLREVFRKLASALHPDRETDAEQRAIKTAQMQRVNQAYQNNDLLTLLELQLEIEQVDAGHMARADVNRVKHYNKVLADQLRELKSEISRVEHGFMMDFGVESVWSVSPLKLGTLLKQETQRLRFELSQVNREIAAFGDVASTKRWLKQVRKQMEEDDDFGMDDLF